MRNTRNGAAKPGLEPIGPLRPVRFILVALIVVLTSCKTKTGLDLALEGHRLNETVPEFLEREHWPTAMDDCSSPAHVVPKAFRENRFISVDRYCALFKRGIMGEFVTVDFYTPDGNVLSASFKEGKITCVIETYPGTSYADLKVQFVKQFGPPYRENGEAGKELTWWWNSPVNKVDRGGLEIRPGLPSGNIKEHWRLNDTKAELHFGKARDNCGLL